MKHSESNIILEADLPRSDSQDVQNSQISNITNSKYTMMTLVSGVLSAIVYLLMK
jgi:hypothetical protein